MSRVHPSQALNIGAWTLTGIVAMVAMGAWGQGLSWQLGSLSAYQLFPVFGLLAFSLMWTHYVVDFVREHLTSLPRPTIRRYFEITSLLVLLAILAHPGLLIWQLWQDGFDLPPGSYLTHYVAPALRGAAILGSISLCIFLLFELRRWCNNRKWWKYVLVANDIAMLAIFYHGLRLGGNLQVGWLKWLWYFYGTTLLGILVYKYYRAYGIKRV